MDPVKIAGITEWPTPMNKKEVQSFLGFTNFYRQFIRDFSEHARPLFNLTQNDSGWRLGTWEKLSAPHSLGWREVSLPLWSSSLLTRPNPSTSKLTAPDFATGAVLSQIFSEDEKWHPVAFLSKSLSPVERNYEIQDKEMLAIIWALQEWRHFIKGVEHQCKIWMDHKNLEYFMTAKQLNWRQAQWSLYLSCFNFTLHHKPRKSMGKPHALSRRSDHGTGADDNSDIMLLTRNSLRYVHWTVCSSLDWNRISCKTSGKELSSRRRNPLPEPHRNYGSHPPTPSNPRNGRNTTASSTTVVASMSRTLLTSATG